MGKLHEVLSVEFNIKATAEAIVNESINVFSKKHDHFVGLTRTYTPKNDDGEKFPSENKEMVTTVKDKLTHTEKHFTRFIDLTYQKELANRTAKADLVVKGKVLAKDVPATFLLNMENRFTHLRKMYQEIPTLDPGPRWVVDTQKRNTYTADPTFTYKSHKVTKPLVLYPATDRHPAQVDKITVDETVGTWETVQFSGKISPVRKAELLENLDTLIEALKSARCRANDEEVPSALLGAALFEVINAGTDKT